jgi:hypothetical protein
VVGDVGGVIETLMLFFTYFIVPIATHSFYVKAINKMYLAYTTDPKIFKAKRMW